MGMLDLLEYWAGEPLLASIAQGVSGLNPALCRLDSRAAGSPIKRAKAPSGRRARAPQQRAVKLRGRDATGERHREIEFSCKIIQDPAHAGLTGGGKTVDTRAAEADVVGAKRERLLFIF